MKYIAAAEDGYASANKYFLLLWGVIALVGLTAYFEMREIAKDRREAARIIEIYDELLAPTESVSASLVRVVAAGPHFNEPSKLFAEMRANTLLSRALLSDLQSTVSQRQDISTDTRLRINLAINPMLALLFFNNSVLLELGLVPVEEEQGLLLATVDVGAFATAPSVGDLRVQDAVRYLWLAAIPMRDMMAAADDLRDLAASQNVADPTTLAERLEEFSALALRRSTRDTARALWVPWLNALPAPGSSPSERIERLAMEQLRLKDPAELTVSAFRTQSLADARQSGGQVEVALPGLDVPIRLSEVIVFLPLLVSFCLAAIYIYTARGLRYGKAEHLDKTHQIVGKTPVYYALYGISDRFGWITVLFALSLPVAGAAWLGWSVVPSALSADWALYTFGAGLLLSVALLLLTVFQSSAVRQEQQSGGTVESAMPKQSAEPDQ